MAPFKSSAGRNLGKLLEGYKSSTLGQGFGSGGGGGTSFIVTGGTVSDGINSGSYTYYVFTEDTPAPQRNLVVAGGDIPAPSVTIMAIGGGGGGGSGHAGGGGAGALVLLPAGSSELPEGVYPINIGAGGRGAQGPGDVNGPNIGPPGGGDTTFGAHPSNYYILAGGGGRGGGWNSNIGLTLPTGGSGGGIAGDGSTNTFPSPSVQPVPNAFRFNGNATVYANQCGQSNNGSPVSRGGTGGGGAGTRGQGSEPIGPNTNPTSIPTNHPNYPNGSRTGLSPFPASPADMASGPFGTTIWPSVSATGLAGAWGGHGLAVPEFPAIALAPAIPAPQQTAFVTEVTANGYYAAGGGGGSHGASMATPNGGGMGGIGGGGQGGRHQAPNTNGFNAAYGTGSGGGGAGSQPNFGGDGAAGVVFVRIER